MRLLLLAFAFLLTSVSLPAAPAKSDAAIESNIRARLAKSKIAVNGFTVRVQNGTAVWTGTTDVIQHKGAATRMAKAAGATKVDNRITIGARARELAAQRLHRTDRSTSAKKEQPSSDRREAATPQVAPLAQPTPASPTAALAPPPVRRAVVRRP